MNGSEQKHELTFQTLWYTTSTGLSVCTQTRAGLCTLAPERHDCYALIFLEEATSNIQM